jgi:hypothetical protein
VTRLLFPRLALFSPIVLFVSIYGAAAGRGFIQDDFAWIEQSRVRSWSDATGLFQQDNGFYRPVVALTFAIDEAIGGIDARVYGWTNVALAVGCALAIGWLARGVGLPWPAAIAAGWIWLLNFQGIRMAVLWTSGRTALLLTLAAASCAAAFVRRRYALATALLLVALFSKEEAVLLPAILLGWYVVLRRGDSRHDRRAVWMWVSFAGLAEIVYFLARSQTSAMTPFAAPSYYTPTFDVVRLASNVVSYADRVVTFPALVAVVAIGLLGRPRPWLAAAVRGVRKLGTDGA